MAYTQIYRGMFDEIIARHGKELSGQHVSVLVDHLPASGKEASQPFYEAATPEEWIEALRAWAASHKAKATYLSDESVDRESIYEGRGE